MLKRPKMPQDIGVLWLGVGGGGVKTVKNQYKKGQSACFLNVGGPGQVVPGRGTLATGVPGCFISRQKRLCHPNAQKLFSLLHSGLLMNNPPSSFKDVLINCFSYKMGKSKILQFPAHRTITTSCFGLIHINVWEISPTISHSHHKYFFHIHKWLQQIHLYLLHAS